MSSFTPALIAPAPCRPIPLVRNRHHQTRYQRLSRSRPSSVVVDGQASSTRTFSPSSSSAVPPASCASSTTEIQALTRGEDEARMGGGGGGGGFFTSSSAGPSSATETANIDYDRTPTRKLMQSLSASIQLGSSSGAVTGAGAVVQAQDSYSSTLSSPTQLDAGSSTGHRQPGHKSWTALDVPTSTSISTSCTPAASTSTPPPTVYPSAESSSSPNPSERDATFSPASCSESEGPSTPFLSSLCSAARTRISPWGGVGGGGGSSVPMSPELTVMPGHLGLGIGTGSGGGSSTGGGGGGAILTPFHPSLVPPSPIPRRLTRNPFARSLSLGLGVGPAASGPSDARLAEVDAHADADTGPSGEGATVMGVPRSGVERVGLGMMELDLGSDAPAPAPAAVDADDDDDEGERALLRVERERRRRSLAMAL